MRVESRARSRALQALYAWDLRQDADLIASAERIWDDLHVGPVERRVATKLVREVAASLSGIDADLKDLTSNWRLERLGVIERAILRLGSAELRIGETPPRVVIQESVRLAKRYGTDESARFVNGILDALARRMALL